MPVLSTKEVREVFRGNTVTAATGETFYWDANGTVVGKGSYGGSNKGNWNITEDGRLCVSNGNSSHAPAAAARSTSTLPPKAARWSTATAT
jgi:hypothetical protein